MMFRHNFKPIATLAALLMLVSDSVCQIKASFNIDSTESCAFLVPNIKNNSTPQSEIVSYTWDLGGTIITQVDPIAPSRAFTKAGAYLICLTVTDKSGLTDKSCQRVFVYNPPVIDFEADKIEGCAPLTVTFKQKSFSQNGKISSFTWDLGGSANIVQTNDLLNKPTTTYDQKVSQSITLKVVDEKGCSNTLTKKDYIKIIAPLEVKPIVKYIARCTFPWSIEIQNANIDPQASYEWDLGNGKSYIGPNPGAVTYDQEGNYTIKVTTKLGACQKVFTFEDLIKIVKEKTINFKEDSICYVPGYQLTSASTFTSDSVKWFLNGKYLGNFKSISSGPMKVGCNSIDLVRYVNGCTDTLTKQCLYVKPVDSIAYQVDNAKTCLLPAVVKIKGTGLGDWKWQLGPTKFSTKDTSIRFNAFTSSVLFLTHTSESGCVLKDSVQIEIKKFEAELPFLGPQGCSPMNFNLADSVASDLPISAYKWTIFGPDKLEFSNKAPSFSITQVGRYDVQLIVTNSIGCIDTVLRKNYLGVGNKPIVEFKAEPLDDCRKTPRSFFDLSSNIANQWLWDFGDGSPLSTERNPVHTYPDTGKFTVTLRAGQNGCFGDLVKKDYIRVKAPIAKLARLYRCEDPTLVSYTNQVIYADTSYWIVDYLGVKPIDTLRTLNLDSLRFPGFGSYKVTIVAENFSTGCLDTSTDSLVITNPKVTYDLDTLRGCAPLTINLKKRLNDIDSIFLYQNNLLTSDSIFTYNTPGIFQSPLIIGQDIHKCKDTFKLKDSILVNAITLNASVPLAVCIPDSLKLIDKSQSLFANIVSNLWIFAEKDTIDSSNASLFINNLNPINISQIVTDAWGCKVSNSYTIKAIDINPSINMDSVACTSAELLLIAGGTNEFTEKVDWTFSDGGIVLDKLFTRYNFKQEGKYNISMKLTDLRGCSKTIVDSVEVVDPIADFDGNNLYATCPPLLSNFLNQSKNANSYRWFFGDGSGSNLKDVSHIYNTVDSFDVMLIASSSETCHDTILFENYVIVQGPIAKVEAKPISNCAPLEVEVTVASDKPYFYIWDDDQGNVYNEPGKKIFAKRAFTYTKVGEYTARVIVKDDNNCPITYESDKIKVNDLEIDFDLVDEPFCNSIIEPKIINKTRSSANINSFNWLLEGAGFFSLRTDSIPQFQINDRGRYDLTLIVNSENCIDTLTKPGLIYVASPPLADFTFPPLVCQSQALVLQNTSSNQEQGVLKLSWLNQARQQIGQDSLQVFTPKIEGNNLITLIIENEAKCKDTIEKIIQVVPEINVRLYNDTILCIGESSQVVSTIIGKDIKSIRLFDQASGQTLCSSCSSITITPSVKQNIILQVDNNSGCLYSDTITIDVAPIAPPKFDLVYPKDVCKDSVVKLSITPMDPDWTITWKSLDKVLCSGSCPEISYTPKGNERVNVLVTNNTYKCFSKDTSSFNIESSIPDFLVNQKIVCEGDSVELSLRNVFSYKWSVPGYSVCDTCATIKFIPKGKVLATASAFSSVGCQYIDTAIVYTMDKRLIDAGNDTIVCKGTQLQLKGFGFGILSWSPPNLVNDSTAFNPKFLANASQTLYFKARNDECILTDSIKVKVIEKIDLEASNDTLCPKSMASVTAKTNGFDLKWRNVRELTNPIFKDDTLSFLAFQDNRVVWSASFPTCPTVFDTSVIKLKDAIAYFLKRRFYEISLNGQKYVESTFDSSKINRYEFKWNHPEILSCTDCPRPLISNVSENTYVNLEIRDLFTGCILKDSLLVRVKQECTSDGFYLPNILSQGSVINNQFNIQAVKPEEFRAINIFDRWGNNVYTSTDLTLKWDGHYLSHPAAQGVYVVRIDAICAISGEPYSFIKDVTVIP